MKAVIEGSRRRPDRSGRRARARSPSSRTQPPTASPRSSRSRRVASATGLRELNGRDDPRIERPVVGGDELRLQCVGSGRQLADSGQARPPDPQAGHDHEERDLLVGGSSVRQHGSYARFLAEKNARPPTTRPRVPTTSAITPMVLANEAEPEASDADVDAARTSFVTVSSADRVRDASASIRAASSLFAGNWTCGNAIDDMSSASEKVFGPPVNDSSIFVPATLPVKWNV